MSFEEMKAEFIHWLRQLSLSTQGVRELLELAPRLGRYESVNKAKGRIKGKLTQVNDAGGELCDDSWATAERLVGTIGDLTLSARFDEARDAATASPTHLNSVEGEVASGAIVVQINQAHGGIHW